MSISNRHSVNPFKAGKSAPLNGQRLIKVGYKKTKDIPNPLPSVCVSVPFLDTESIDDNSMERLTPHILNFLQDTQDKIIRSLYESSDGALLSVADHEISVSQCINFLEAENDGGRLKKEFLQTWFNENVKDNLTVLIAEKLGTENIEDERIAKTVKVYCELISGLAGGKTLYVEQQIKAVRIALKVISEDDDISEKLELRLKSMEKKPDLSALILGD